MKKWIGNLLILSSVVVFIWLWSGSIETQQEQDQMIEAFAAVKATGEIGEVKAMPPNRGTVQEEVKSAITSNVEGVLSIPSIELKAPVLAGANPENLNQALGSISGMDKPGVVNGSYAIAGHRSHIFGEFFNRLNELQIGERLTFETMEESIKFEVFDRKIVEPHEVESLNRKKGIALLSLVTCYPENSNKYRLIVYAKRID